MPNRSDLTDIWAIDSTEEAQDIHARHLGKLGELGLVPWFSAIKPGLCADFNDAPGLYIQQDVLPSTSQTVCDTDPEAKIIEGIYAEYATWAHRDKVILSDIQYPYQSSKVNGALVLHDVEPLYTRKW